MVQVSGEWAGNGLVFATREEAEDNARAPYSNLRRHLWDQPASTVKLSTSHLGKRVPTSVCMVESKSGRTLCARYRTWPPRQDSNARIPPGTDMTVTDNTA